MNYRQLRSQKYIVFYALMLLAAASPSPAFAQAPVALADQATSEAPAEAPIVEAIVSVRALIVAGQFQQALLEVERILQRSPDDDDWRVQHARLLYWLGRHEQAEAETRLLRQRRPTDMEVTDLLAQILLARGNLRASVEFYQALQTGGDMRPEVSQRIVDLLLELEDAAGVEHALAIGGNLDDEQTLKYEKLRHPWLSNLILSSNLHDLHLWPRVDVDLGKRVSKSATILAGVFYERRYTDTKTLQAFAPKVEGYFSLGHLDLMAHLNVSPSLSFLPLVDARADAMFGINNTVSAGIYLRGARYTPANVTSTTSLTFAPNAQFFRGRWIIQPGYMAIVNLPGSVLHSIFFKFRFQYTAHTAFLLWTFLGQDPTAVERFGTDNLAQSTGISALLGVDHWLTPRYGVRFSFSRVQPFSDSTSAFTEVTLGVRGRF